jgi:hypothetical protein
MNTTAETVSSCIQFASSLRNAVGFAVATSHGEQIRNDIKGGKHEGVSFPEPKTSRLYNSPFSQDERRRIVAGIHSLRREGKKARWAAEDFDISYQTYSRWIDEEEMPYTGPSLSGRHVR